VLVLLSRTVIPKTPPRPKRSARLAASSMTDSTPLCTSFNKHLLTQSTARSKTCTPPLLNVKIITSELLRRGPHLHELSLRCTARPVSQRAARVLGEIFAGRRVLLLGGVYRHQGSREAPDRAPQPPGLSYQTLLTSPRYFAQQEDPRQGAARASETVAHESPPQSPHGRSASRSHV